MKIKLLFVAITLIASYTLTAQVAINTDDSNPDASAILDLKSTGKGLLIPRMTNNEMTAITSPANGLLVFSITDDKFYAYIASDNVFKEVEFGTGTIALHASYTIGSGGSCSNTAVNGSYLSGYL